MSGQHDAVPLPGIDAERNREMIAERLGWPGDAAGVCGDIGKRFPGYYAWWTPLPYPDPGFRPAWGAALAQQPADRPRPGIYARTPAELIELIGEDTAKQQASRDTAGQRDE